MTREHVFRALPVVAFIAAFVAFYVLVRGTLPKPVPPAAAPMASPGVEVRVPRSPSPTPDGHLDEPAWSVAETRTGAFVDATGKPARPFSEARFAQDGDALWIGLYAADGDIRGPSETDPMGDAFLVELDVGGRKRGLVVRYQGSDVPTRGLPGILAEGAYDADGTPDVPGDDDEEWVAELRLPLTSLEAHGEPIGVVIQRIDGEDGGDLRRRGRWPRTGVRARLLLVP